MLFGSTILFLEYIFNWGISNTFRVLLSLQLSLWKGKCFQRFKDGTNESRQVTKLVETAEYWRVWNSWWCVCGLKLVDFPFVFPFFQDQLRGKKVCVCVCVWERERERENCSNGYWRQWESWIRERRQRWWKEGKLWQIKGNWNHSDVDEIIFPDDFSWPACARSQFLQTEVGLDKIP